MSKERDLLVSCLDEFQYHDVPCSDLIRTIKWLLNEPEQPEPVAWRYKTHNRYTYAEENYHELEGEGEPLYTAPPKPEQTEQEPMAWMNPEWGNFISHYIKKNEPMAWMNPEWGNFISHYIKKNNATHSPEKFYIPLYLAPPKREPLSDKEILNLWANKSPANEFECVRLVEKAHGIGGGE